MKKLNRSSHSKEPRDRLAARTGSANGFAIRGFSGWKHREGVLSLVHTTRSGEKEHRCG
jgi:hypothetical protein